MSESSSKNSVKKGFTAPIIKESAFNKVHSTDHDNDKQSKKQKTKNDSKEKAKEDKVSPEKSKKNLKQKQNKEDKLSNNQEPFQTDKKQKKIKTKKGNDLAADQESVQTVRKQTKDNKEENIEKATDFPKNEIKPSKPQVSMTDSQYEEIFDAVLKGSKNNSASLQNTPVDDVSMAEQIQQAPLSENSGKEGSEKRSSVPTTPLQKSKILPQVSPWGSHFSKQASQGSSILKEIETESSLVNSSCVLSPSGSSDTSSVPSQHSQEQLVQAVQVLPQRQSRKNQRKRLEELQRCRNVGVWVFCDRMSCQKQRYLPYVTDPQDLPDIWYCHMNRDPKFNNCQYEEQLPSAEEEQDMIYNSFTAGSVVWARVAGYPWWPAMVDDDPDLEQYYWLLEDFFTVTHYHVVFFDEGSVTRAWVDLKHISSYARHDNKYKQMVCRGIDFSRRIQVAKEQANDALTLSSYQRLTIYSFIARYKGPISTSHQKSQNTMKKYKLKAKKDLNSHEDTDVAPLVTKKDQPKKNPNKRKRQIKEFESSTIGSKNSKIQKIDTEKTTLENKAAKKTKRKIAKKPLNSSNGTMDSDNDMCAMKPPKSTSNGTEGGMERMSVTDCNFNVNVDAQQKSQDIQENVRSTDHIETVGNSSSSDTYLESTENPVKLDSTHLSGPSQYAEDAIDKNAALQTGSETPSLIASNAIKEADPTILPGPSHPIKNAIDRNTVLENESETQSFTGGGVDQLNTEDTIGSVVEPSQAVDGASQSSKSGGLSQSTIADFFAESEDGVVPDMFILSQGSHNSLPFEE